VVAIIFAPQEFIMRKLLVIIFALAATVPAFSQTTETKKEKDKKKDAVLNRAGDHFMIQLANNTLTSLPDSISSHVKGLNRSANVYLMIDKPFKGDPRFSAAFGIGISTANIYFKNMLVDISSSSTKLPFTAVDSAIHYKRYKLAATYLEIPVELRFSKYPSTPNKTLKGAIGVKIGTLLNAHTKGKNLLNAAGGKLSDVTEKIAAKDYFNTTKLSVTGRIGYGNFSIFGSYALTSMFKDGVAPPSKLLQIGLTISGL
jgi:hypothetical protein